MSLLLKQEWNAHPDWYDYLNQIDFPGNKLVTGGGQRVNMECGITADITHRVVSVKEAPIYDYSGAVLVEEGEMKLKYHEIESLWEACPKFDKINDTRWIPYKIYKGKFLLTCPWGYPILHQYKLVLGTNPMPNPQRFGLMAFIEGSQIWKQTDYFAESLEEPKWFRIPLFKGKYEHKKPSRWSTYRFLYQPKYFPNEI